MGFPLQPENCRHVMTLEVLLHQLNLGHIRKETSVKKHINDQTSRDCMGILPISLVCLQCQLM